MPHEQAPAESELTATLRNLLGALRDPRELEKLQRSCADSERTREQTRAVFWAMQGTLARVSGAPVRPSWMEVLIDGGDWRSCYPWDKVRSRSTQS